MNDQQIPFLDLVSPHRELEEQLVAASRAAIRSAHFIGGPEVEGFEREFAEYCGTRFCVGVASGTDGVRFALMAAGVKPGDAVITVANTFIATVEGISQAGAQTEFVDVDERTCNMSASSLADYLAACQIDSQTGRPLGRRTGKPIAAVVPVHLYGQVADMPAIRQIADRYRLTIVEDACQAHGAKFGEARAGSFGTGAAFSFYPGKNLGACGEAGAVTTNDTEIARTVRMLREHGQSQKYYHDVEGYNGRLDSIQAAFLRIKLRRLESWNSQRRDAARRYAELFNRAMLGSIAPVEPEWSRAAYHLYVIKVNDRDGLATHLKSKRIDTGLHYPVPVHLQKCYRERGFDKVSLPVTEQVTKQILSLPMFPGLTLEQQQRVVEEVAAFVSADRLHEGFGAQAAFAKASAPKAASL
jgi:dTDP-4-amino-4,6-dideoxygalactose transaminase